MNKITSEADNETELEVLTECPDVPEYPVRLLMDLRTDCNLKCPMCIVHGGTDDPRLKAWLRRSMPIDKAREILDQVMEAKPLVQPSLWSEPTMAHDFKEHIRSMKERGLTVALNTNGLTIRPALAHFFVDVQLDSVSVSIDAHTKETLKLVRGIDKLEKIHRAVETLLEARQDAALPRIGVSFTVQKKNEHEREAFVDYWTPKVDFVRVGALFEDGRFPGFKAPGPRKPCPSLYSTMAVHVTGDVSYCCLDGFGETNLGNVFEKGVKGVWHGAEFQQVRHYHETGQWDKVPFCKSCDRWASDDYEEEIIDGYLIRRSVEYVYYNRIDRLENWRGELVATHDGPEDGVLKFNKAEQSVPA